VALHLDHGKVDRAISYAFRNGFSSIMFDGSEYPFEENVRRTRKVVELGHLEGVSVEGELGHVGVGAAGDHARRDLYTRPEDARRFVEETGVDALAVAFGTAHGPYPKGIIPTLDFDRLKAIKDSLGMPIVMHGGSSSGDDNIRHAVKCGINKINVCSDTFVACVDAVAKVTSEDPGVGFIKLLNLMEKAAADTIGHYIELASSVGKAANFAPFFDPYRAFWVKTEKKLHE